MQFDFVLPVVYNDQDIAYNSALAVNLEREGASVALIAHTQKGAAVLRERHSHVFYLYEGFDRSVPADTSTMRALEDRYDLGSFADLVYPEQVVPGAQSQEMLFRRGIHDFRFLEDLCTRHDVRMFVNNLGPELLRRCMFRLRDKGGPQNIVFDFAPIHGRFVLTTDEVIWDELPKELPTLTAEQRARMVTFVRDATAARKAFADPAALTLGFRNVVNAARYVKQLASEPLDLSLSALVRQRFDSLVQVRAARMLYERPPGGEDYYFFPLHIADDSAITVRAPQFQRQQELVRFISERVLPVGTKLYVKPHPAALHAYPYAVLSEIASTPNVRLIDPRIVAHDLIRESRALIVINSTAGFEALLYGKPVVSVGNVFYRGFGLTTDVGAVSELPQAVVRAVRNPPDMERTYQFLHACHEATYPGALTTNTPENVALQTAAVLEKARKLRLGIEPATAAASRHFATANGTST